MQDQMTVDLWRYVAIVKRWLWLLVLATVLGAGAGYVFSKMQVPVYQASTTLLINAAPNSTRGADYNSVLMNERLAQTYAQLVTQRMVLEQVLPTIPYSLTTDQLKAKVGVRVVQNTQLINVTAEDPSPDIAARMANGLAHELGAQVQAMNSEGYQASQDRLQAQMNTVDASIQQTRRELDALPAGDSAKDQRDRLEGILATYQGSYNTLLGQYEQTNIAEAQNSSTVKQTEVAVPPVDPVRPRVPTNTLLAGVVGLLLALGVVFLVEMLDDTLKSPAQLAAENLGVEGQANLPVLGFIPFFDATSDTKLPVTAAQPRSPIAERFRVLRTNVQFTGVDKPLRTILVTSPAPGDGKTTVAANLAVALAQSGRSVSLLDADLRRPSMHKKLNMANTAGVSALFVQPQIHLNGNLQATGLPGLSLLTGGVVPPNPSELLGSRKMQEILRLVQGESEVVIVDSPPITSVTDAVVLSGKVDGVLLVVRPGMTKLAACREAIEELRRSGANVLGLVVNGVKPDEARYYNRYTHYAYYHYYSQDGRPDSAWARLERRLGLKRHHHAKRPATGDVPVEAWIQPEPSEQKSGTKA